MSPRLSVRILWYFGLIFHALAYIRYIPLFRDEVFQSKPAIVLGSTVLESYHLGFVTVALGWLCWLGSACIFIRARARKKYPKIRNIKLVGVVTIGLLTLLVTVFSLLIYMLFHTGRSYAVVGPSSEDSCDLILSSKNHFKGSHGDFYVSGSGFFSVDSTDNRWYRDTPGFNAITEINWNIAWNGNDATVEIHGETPSDFAFYGETPITCERVF